MGEVVEAKFGDPVRRVIGSEAYVATELGSCVMCLEDILPGQRCTRKVFVWENCRFPEATGPFEWNYHDVCADNRLLEMLRQDSGTDERTVIEDEAPFSIIDEIMGA